MKNLKRILLSVFLLTSCQEAQFFGYNEVDKLPERPIPPVVIPPMDRDEREDYRQSCKKIHKKYYRLLDKYKVLNRYYRSLARRHTHHMKRYHCDDWRDEYGNREIFCYDAK